jgi:hypothetical protein
MNTSQPTQPTAGAMRAIHTPKPWCAEKGAVFKGGNPIPNALYVADCTFSAAHRTPEEIKANAQLIAASPDLLEASEAALAILARDLSQDSESLRAMQLLGEAITKATKSA